MKAGKPVKVRLFLAFSDLAVIVALKDRAMTGYAINNYFVRKIGYIASPSAIYSTLVSLERKGLIKCVGNNIGRVYCLTDEGRKIVDNIDITVKESQRFMDKLLTSKVTL